MALTLQIGAYSAELSVAVHANNMQILLSKATLQAMAAAGVILPGSCVAECRTTRSDPLFIKGCSLVRGIMSA